MTKVIDRPKTKRHHASKNFKPFRKEKLKDRMMNTDNPTKEDLIIIEEMCKMWWNGLKSGTMINIIISALECTNDVLEKEEILKPLYYWIADRTPGFKRKVKRSLFTYNFIMGQNLFRKWINQEIRSKKENIKSMVQIDLLNLFGNLKKLKKPVIEKRLSDYRKHDIEMAIKSLLCKNAISELPLTQWNEQYYQINAICDDEGWYVP